VSAYLVFHNRVHNREQVQAYLAKAIETLAAHQHEVLVLDEDSQAVEGPLEWPRTVIVKFDSRAAAMAWYNSPEYQEILPMRLGATEGFAVLVDGLAPPAS
jgi:uncharacterized protein (DUF1330 family)